MCSHKIPSSVEWLYVLLIIKDLHEIAELLHQQSPFVYKQTRSDICSPIQIYLQTVPSENLSMQSCFLNK